MRTWLKVAIPLGFAAVVLSVLAISFGSASSLAAPGGNGRGGGNHVEPSLVIVPNPHASVGQTVEVWGQDFPRSTSVFVLVTQVSPVHSSLPSLLVETDSSGGFMRTTSFDDAGEYTFSACFYQRKGGGSWVCDDVTPKTLEVTE